jgi:diaminohydroxyphosphoribosylaminopyrimidine deaminase/5-amino-6-(5-phosphoribosylamino)uracil reductase
MAGRRPAAITGEAARRRAHLMRAMSDAVATGIATVLADDPLLTCRLPGMHSPVRVVLDSRLRLPLASRLVASTAIAPVWVITGESAPVEVERKLVACGLVVLRVPELDGQLDLHAALRKLSSRGITRLMIEAGPILTTALMRADLVDELTLFRSSAVLGDDALDALSGLPLSALTHPSHLKPVSTEAVGEDRLEMFERPLP